jgi:uncharacterized protein
MESPMIISNITPLINFAEIGRMEVLEVLFGTFVIPPAVLSELAAKALLFPQAARVPSRPFVKFTAPEDQLLVKSLTTRVHPGEAECLALAMKNPGSLLLLDDLGAREIAASHGLLYTGTLGGSVKAKKRGLIPEIAPSIQELKTKARFWISDHLEERVLRDAGEK